MKPGDISTGLNSGCAVIGIALQWLVHYLLFIGGSYSLYCIFQKTLLSNNSSFLHVFSLSCISIEGFWHDQILQAPLLHVADGFSKYIQT